MPAHTHSLEQCIENCLRCHRICLEVAGRHFRGEATIEAPHLRLLLDCAEICHTSASFMIRGSDLHGETCAACAAVCEACADECDRHGEDPHMAACGEVCRRCAQSCREMAGASSSRR
jgi:Domain of Unknown Function (DUF326)